MSISSDFLFSVNIITHELVLASDLEDAAVPEIGGSLTSVSWDEELADVFDSSRPDDYNADRRSIECIATDDWYDLFLFTDDDQG